MLAQMALEQAARAEQERQQRIATAWQRYHGEWPEPLKKTASDPKGEDNVRLNFAKLIVNKGAAALFGFDLQFQVGEQDSAQSDSERWLLDCLDANRRMTTLMRLGVNGGVAGQAFVRIYPPDPAANGHPFPRIVVWDPGNVSVLWAHNDYERVLEYRYTWNAINPETGRPAVYRQVIARDGGQWLITDQVSRFGGGAALGPLAWDEAGPPAVWPYPWPPVVTCQNLPCPNEWWGLADLEGDVLAVNAAINFSASNIARILRIHAHPKSYATGVAATQLQIPVDGVICLPNSEARLANLEMASDLSASLEFGRGLREALHELARIPEVATGKVDGIGSLSGVALSILYGPLIELTETKRLTYGELLDELGRRLLELGGHTPERVRPQWPEIVPADPGAEADTALLHQELGVSRNTLLSKLGYDPEDELARSAEEKRAAQELGKGLLRAFDHGEEDDAGETETETE